LGLQRCGGGRFSSFRVRFSINPENGMLSFQMLCIDFQNRAEGVLVELMRQGLISQKKWDTANPWPAAARVNAMPASYRTSRQAGFQ
jgi:hypothetical protein